jgi:hypothetical protein
LDAVEKKLDLIQFGKPVGLEDIHAQLIESMSSAKKIISLQRDLLKETQETDKNLQSLITNRLSAYPFENDEDLFTVISEACDEFAPANFQDTTLADSNFINMGLSLPASCAPLAKEALGEKPKACSR